MSSFFIFPFSEVSLLVLVGDLSSTFCVAAIASFASLLLKERLCSSPVSGVCFQVGRTITRGVSRYVENPINALYFLASFISFAKLGSVSLEAVPHYITS